VAARYARVANGFRDGDPGEKVYKNLDFHPRVQSFLTAMPRASLSAVRNGCRSFGPEDLDRHHFRDAAGLEIGVPHANTETVYTINWIVRRAAIKKDPGAAFCHESVMKTLELPAVPL